MVEHVSSEKNCGECFCKDLFGGDFSSDIFCRVLVEICFVSAGVFLVCSLVCLAVSPANSVRSRIHSAIPSSTTTFVLKFLSVPHRLVLRAVLLRVLFGLRWRCVMLCCAVLWCVASCCVVLFFVVFFVFVLAAKNDTIASRVTPLAQANLLTMFHRHYSPVPMVLLRKPYMPRPSTQGSLRQSLLLRTILCRRYSPSFRSDRWNDHRHRVPYPGPLPSTLLRCRPGSTVHQCRRTCSGPSSVETLKPKLLRPRRCLVFSVLPGRPLLSSPPSWS